MKQEAIAKYKTGSYPQLHPDHYAFIHGYLAGAEPREKQISDMSDIINDLVHLGTFDENTDEEYLNYEVHEALKKAEKYLPK